MGLLGSSSYASGFLNSVFTFILDVLINLANFVVNLFLIPILAVINVIFPSMTQSDFIFTNFLNQFIIPGVTFARELFLNITGYPRELLSMLALIFIAKITYHITIIPIKFLIRIISSLFKIDLGGSTTTTNP